MDSSACGQPNSLERGDIPGSVNVATGTRSEASIRPGGKPLCWYGASCRKIADRAHCDRYDHQIRPCKFGEKCRRQGQGCRYQHPETGAETKPLLGTAAQGNHCHNELAGNSLEAGEPEPERPVPFIFLLVCVCALGLLVVPILGSCNAARHQKIFYLGCALGVPYVLLELLLFTKRSWVLRKFLEGDYSEKATCRQLGCLWYPVPLQLLRYTTGDVAGNNIEQYATWETNDVQMQVDNAMGGNRDGGQVTRDSHGFNLEFPTEFSGTAATVDAAGEIEGLSVHAKFDGSNIVSRGGAWSKGGYWRLDLVSKVFLLLFMVGVECIFVAISMPPGVTGMGGLDRHKRMPLNAVFVVDGSASIAPEMWQAQQKAGEEFIQAFQKTYGQKHGELNMGIVQFSSDARTEQQLTGNIPEVLAKFQSMEQMKMNTFFDKGLSFCRQNLDDFESSKSQRETFDVCVLITDGIDMSKMSPKDLQDVLPGDTAIFGIFVGQDDNGIQLLKNITECGKAASPKHPCNFFASATDYAALSAKADDVASEVTRGVDLAMCAMVSALIGVPAALGMCLPYILWYASCTGLTLWRRRHESNNSRSVKNNGFSNNE